MKACLHEGRTINFTCLAPLRIAFGLGTFPVVVKEALTMIGIDAGPAILPVGPMTPENREKLLKVLADTGMLK